jgi:aryl-alcohol dehydrogenase-like predicted oxidoreductase
MEYRRLGRTGLRVSVVGLGTGGPSQFGQRRGAAPAAAHRLVQRALDHGINFFDTAQAYRASEAWLGSALAGVPRDRYILATKYDYRGAAGRVLSPGELRTTIDRRLVELGTDRIDLLQIHGLLPDRYDEVIEQHLPELQRAQAAGKLRFIGVSEKFSSDWDHAMLRRALADRHFDTVMVGSLRTPRRPTWG